MEHMSKDDIVAIINAALASHSKPARKGRKGKGSRVASTPEQKALRMAANDAECIKVFTAAGYKDVQPRVNVLTYGKIKPDGSITGWLGQGRQVKKGEHGLKVGPFNLFHVTQTEVIGKSEPVAPASAEKPATSAATFNWQDA